MALYLKNLKVSIVSLYDTFLFDCDGVIWTGEKVIKGVIDVLNQLDKYGKKLFFVVKQNKNK